MRTNYCAQLSSTDLGQTVTLAGWVNRRRDFGAITFVDLRDRSGLVQLLFDGDSQGLDEAHTLNREDVIQVTGIVSPRSEGNVNPDMATGEIEIRAKQLVILNRSKTPPFLVESDGSDTTEETRLRYRYVDLRREKLQRSLELRHRVFRTSVSTFRTRVFGRSRPPF